MSSGRAKRVKELPRLEMVSPVRNFQKSILSLRSGAAALDEMDMNDSFNGQIPPAKITPQRRVYSSTHYLLVAADRCLFSVRGHRGHAHAWDRSLADTRKAVCPRLAHRHADVETPHPMPSDVP